MIEVACGQYGDAVPGLVVAAKSQVNAEYQNAATAVNEKPINSMKVSCHYHYHFHVINVTKQKLSNLFYLLLSVWCVRK